MKKKKPVEDMRTQQQIICDAKVKTAFTQGYACALVVLLKYERADTAIAREIFHSQLGSIANCKIYGVDEYDLEELKKYFK